MTAAGHLVQAQQFAQRGVQKLPGLIIPKGMNGTGFQVEDALSGNSELRARLGISVQSAADRHDPVCKIKQDPGAARSILMVRYGNLGTISTFQYQGIVTGEVGEVVKILLRGAKEIMLDQKPGKIGGTLHAGIEWRISEAHLPLKGT